MKLPISGSVPAGAGFALPEVRDRAVDPAGGGFGALVSRQGSGKAEVGRVRLPVIGATVDGMSTADRAQSAGSLAAAQSLLRQVQGGEPAADLAGSATSLFERLQGGALTRGDAHEIGTSLRGARDALLQSPSYSQGLVIPEEQSVAEGQIARSLDLVDTALRVPGR